MTSAEHAITETSAPANETPEERELRELRARRTALQAQRTTKEDASALQAEIAKERRAIRDEEALSKAIDEHGPVGKQLATVETDLGMVILRRPSALKFRRFQDKGSFSTEDVTALVRPCVLWPSAGELDVILDDLPATLTRLASAVVALAGHRGEDSAKK
jgi:hypothetical protein